MRQNVLLFDLDGTLTNSKVGITRASSKALAYFGIHEEPENLTHFIGPPLHELFMEMYGFTAEMADEALAQFRLYYQDRGWKENIPYEGIPELLSFLKANGKTLIVATSKPEETSVRILEHFGLAKWFDVICGPPLEPPEEAQKYRVIRRALARAGITDLSSAIMIGDKRHDIEGAHTAGIPGIGVLYGFGSREELTRAGADFLAEDVEALRTLLTD